jgi:Na+/H+ antiporter NhaC
VSREKLAYICDSTSAPICILVPFNGWGAFIIGLLSVQGVESPVAVLFQSILVNFYPMAAIAIVLFTILRKWNIGSMRNAEMRAHNEGKVYGDNARPMIADDVVGVEPMAGIRHRAVNLVAPVVTMVLSIVAGIFLTGRRSTGPDAGLWDIIKASSGSTAVLWAVIMSLLVIAALNLFRGLSLKKFIDLIFKGMGGMIPVVSLLLLAFALGGVVRELGTGVYVAGLISGVLNTKMAVIGLFLISCFVAFSTGTSWGTFAVMVPIAVPMAAALDGSTPMFLAAVLGGGVFGDHCSPISDTTIISSMASASDHIDHVRTQIPYAMVGAVITLILYLILA